MAASILISVSILFTIWAISSAGETCDDVDDYDYINGACISINKTKSQHNAIGAESFCKNKTDNRTWYLPHLDSQEKVEELNDILKMEERAVLFFWIGLRRQEDITTDWKDWSKWYWTLDNSTLGPDSYMPWKGSNPDSSTRKENCVMAEYSNSTEWRMAWHDVDCNMIYTNVVVCELPMPTTTMSTTTTTSTLTSTEATIGTATPTASTSTSTSASPETATETTTPIAPTSTSSETTTIKTTETTAETTSSIESSIATTTVRTTSEPITTTPIAPSTSRTTSKPITTTTTATPKSSKSTPPIPVAVSTQKTTSPFISPPLGKNESEANQQSPPNEDSDSSGMWIGIGIGFGIAVIAALAVIGTVWIVRRRRRRRRSSVLTTVRSVESEADASGKYDNVNLFKKGHIRKGKKNKRRRDDSSGTSSPSVSASIRTPPRRNVVKPKMVVMGRK